MQGQYIIKDVSYSSVKECAEDIESYDTSLWGDEYY